MELLSICNSILCTCNSIIIIISLPLVHYQWLITIGLAFLILSVHISMPLPVIRHIPMLHDPPYHGAITFQCYVIHNQLTFLCLPILVPTFVNSCSSHCCVTFLIIYKFVIFNNYFSLHARTLIRRLASVISTEARAFANNGRAGLTYFAPNINIYR